MVKTDAPKKLREARWAKGWSRRELSEATSPTVSESTIVKIEGEDVKPFPQTVYTLARALGIDPRELIDEEEVSA